jgi:hypothetical protein
VSKAQDEAMVRRIREIHREIDLLAQGVAGQYLTEGGKLVCRRGCDSCCTDDLTVFEVEAARIRDEFGALLEGGTPRAPGACAMLDDEGGCRIYGARPYVCRTQGLLLRWFEEDDDDNVLEYRDICPLNDDGASLELRSDASCWTIGPFEERISALQEAADGGEMRRIALRDLFGPR